MRFIPPLFVVLLAPLLFVSQQLATVTALPLLDRNTSDQACDYRATKGPLVQLWREVAVRDFTRLYLVEKNPKKAFDKWIPG
jgi:hypothetical protein